MRSSVRRGALVGCLALVLAGVLFVRACGAAAPSPEPAAPATAVPRRENPPRSPAEAAAAPAEVATTEARAALRLVDVATGRGIAGASLRVVATGGPDEPLTVTSGVDGAFDVAATARFRVSSATPSVAIVFPERDLAAADREVLACRMVTVTCDVRFTDDPAAPPPIRVAATPSHRAEGQWATDAAKVGTSEWMRIEAPRLGVVHASGPRSPVELRVPVFPEVTLVATADGYLADVRSLRLDGAAASALGVQFELRRARRIAMSVTDEDGTPIAGATFQYAAQQHGGYGLTNPTVIFMLRDVIECGFTAMAFDKTQRSVINAIVNGRTDANGLARIEEPAAGDADYVVVWADGYEPFLRRRGAVTAGDESLEVALKRLTPLCDRYRLMRAGRPLAGCRLVLGEKFDDEFTPALPLVSADADGTISSAGVVPGRTYIATVFDEVHKTSFHGDLVFGASRDVTLDHLMEKR